jgi:hypothetical protein
MRTSPPMVSSPPDTLEQHRRPLLRPVAEKFLIAQNCRASTSTWNPRVRRPIPRCAGSRRRAWQAKKNAGSRARVWFKVLAHPRAQSGLVVGAD